MPDQVFGLTAGAARVLTDVVARHRQQMPGTDRRTRRTEPAYQVAVKFTIEDFDDDTSIATCSIRYVDFGATIPGRDGDGLIEVHDVDGCWFNEDGADLIGRKGGARWMVDPNDTAATPQWCCDELCCGAAEF